MDNEFKKRFIRNWKNYFPGTDFPIGFYYTDVKDPKSTLPGGLVRFKVYSMSLPGRSFLPGCLPLLYPGRWITWRKAFSSQNPGTK
jgi:hypothetical protein